MELFLWKFLVFLLICSVDQWLYRRVATLWILGKYSTRIQSAFHGFGRSFCSFHQLWSILACHFQASLDCGCWWTLPRHNTESEKTLALERWRLITVSLPINYSCFHEWFVDLMLSKLSISSCSLPNFSELSNIFYKMKSVEFLMEFGLSRKFFPMNVAAFIVTAIKHSPN